MLIDFFYTLRSAKLPVSVKEYLTLVEALKEGVVGPMGDDGGWGVDDFYYLSRTALVKDEKHYDKFDRAFLQRLDQRQVFLDRHRQLGAAQRVEEIDQHRFSPLRAWRSAA